MHRLGFIRVGLVLIVRNNGAVAFDGQVRRKNVKVERLSHV